MEPLGMHLCLPVGRSLQREPDAQPESGDFRKQAIIKSTAISQTCAVLPAPQKRGKKEINFFSINDP